jgi:hypothetical protein
MLLLLGAASASQPDCNNGLVLRHRNAAVLAMVLHRNKARRRDL